MNALLKYLLNALFAVVVGGSVPAATGLTGWELYVATGATALALALFNLWQHKPGVVPSSEPVGK